MSGVDKPIMEKASELFGWAYGLGGFDVAVLEFVTFVRAQSDAQIAELEGALLAEQMHVEGLSTELAAIKAQEPVVDRDFSKFNTPCDGRAYVADWFKNVLRRHDYRQYINDRLAGDFACTLANALCQLYATPVSEAKAQGVVMPDNLLSHRVTWRQALARLIELEDVADTETGRDDKAYWQHELRAFDAMYADLDRLNSAPVQQVSVPDDFVCDSKPLQELLNATAMLLETPCQDSATYWAAQLANVEQLLAAPAAPAADAGLVEALEKIAAYAPCSGIKDPGFTKMHMGILARAALAAHRAQGVQ